MNRWYTIEYFVNSVDVSFLFTFTYILMRETKIKFLKVFAAIMIQALINSFANIYFGIGSIKGLIVMFLSTGLVLCLTFGWKYSKTYFYCALGIMLMLITEVLSMVIVLMITKASPNIYYNLNENRMLAVVLSKFSYLMILFTIKKKLIKTIRIDITVRYQIIFIVCYNIFVGFMALWFYKYTYILKGHEIRYIVLMSLGATLFSINMFAIIKKMSDQINNEAEWRNKEREFERQKFYTSSMEEMLKQMKAQRHDFNHHLGCLYGLLNAEKTEEALSYIASLTKDVENLNYYINIEEPVIASILSTKLSKCKKMV